MKKVFSIAVLTTIIASGTWADPPWGSGDSTYPTIGGSLQLQEGPKSVVNETTAELFTSDADDFIDVVNWGNVEYEKWFFTLGGAAKNIEDGQGAFQGGMAMKLGSNHLGVYYGGGTFGPGGTSSGTSSKDNGADENGSSSFNWNSSFAVLFGSEAIGGVRFDARFDNVTFSDTRQAGETTSTSGTGHLVTSLQWGKSLGAFTPKITVGFQWPSYTTAKSGSYTNETWDDAELGIKAEVGFGKFDADFQWTWGFGETTKISGKTGTKAGFDFFELNGGYTIGGALDEKVTVLAKPKVNVSLGLADNRVTSDGKVTGENPGGTFGAGLGASIAGSWAWKPTITLYGGVDVSLIRYEDIWRSHSNEPSDDKANHFKWQITGVTDTTSSANIGAKIKPSEAFSIEANLGWAFNPSQGHYTVNLTSISGSLLLTMKPGAGGGGASDSAASK